MADPTILVRQNNVITILTQGIIGPPGPPGSSGGTAITGTAVLVGGLVIVSEPALLSGAIIGLTIQNASGDLGVPYVQSQTPGVGFAIASSSDTDNSTIGWVIHQ